MLCSITFGRSPWVGSLCLVLGFSWCIPGSICWQACIGRFHRAKCFHSHHLVQPHPKPHKSSRELPSLVPCYVAAESPNVTDDVKIVETWEMKSQMSQSSHKENESLRVRLKSFGLKYSKTNISKNKIFIFSEFCSEKLFACPRRRFWLSGNNFLSILQCFFSRNKVNGPAIRWLTKCLRFLDTEVLIITSWWLDRSKSSIKVFVELSCSKFCLPWNMNEFE